MKIVKRLLKIVFAIIGLLVLLGIIILWIDSSETNYLEINKNESASNNSYLIKNVNIIPMNQDTVLANKMVYIKEGIIQRIADTIKVNGIQVFDAENKYLTPGLIDMHVHVWDRYELGLYLSNGVTAVRNLWGMPMHLRIKEDVKEDNIFSPSFFTTGPKLTGSEFIGDDNLNLSNPSEAKNKVISYKDRGYDFIKTYYGLDKAIFDAVIEQAKVSEIDIIAHPSQKVPFSYHLHPKIKSIEHAEEIVQQPLQFDLDIPKLQFVIDSISASKHTSYSPTLTVFNNIYQMMMNDDILDSEPLKYMNPLIIMDDSKRQFERWYNAKQEDPSTIERIKKQHDFHMTIVKKLHEAGVPIICGTDAGIGVTLPGISIHKELNFYKEAGLSNYEVLKTATVNASQAHTMMKQLGTIEEGKIANLILVDKNPLEELSSLQNPNFVFVKGRKLNRETLDSFNEKAKNRKNLIATALRYLENLIIEK
ncbi:amidohydrolase family protein [Winogradskyella sediminis]|uniref:Imidazolonepropionase n=1 Tax=Winogradskyella sediminis TaxID=1382466 RepID=A0A1H1RUY9_9FLAO|nr:amidohydrolase family protein [Winogradskyella sediminis]REG89402.1 imidazolonepropionase-like amidohydrolase [Winogradskyella sediminis]SDS39532.1 Imidazolonepropionase [Winogradskyella sediminis]